MIGYESLAIFTLQKKMLLNLLGKGSSLVSKEDLLEVEERIVHLNNMGYVDRRVADRREKDSSLINAEKRSADRRVFEIGFAC